MTKAKTLLFSLTLSLFACCYAGLANASITASSCAGLLASANQAHGNSDSFMKFLWDNQSNITACSSQCGNYDWQNVDAGSLTAIAKARGNLAASATCKRKFTQLLFYTNYTLGYSKPPGSVYTQAQNTNFTANTLDSPTSNNLGSQAHSSIPMYRPRKPASVPNNQVDYW